MYHAIHSQQARRLVLTSEQAIAMAVTLKFGELIKQFDGKEDFAEWIGKVEMVATLQDIKKLESFVPLFLSGGAFAVYQSLSADTKTDYSKLKNALLKAFSMNCFAAFEAFVSRTYQHGESVDVYLADLRRLGKLIQTTTDESWIRCAFVRGLPKSVRMQLQALSTVESMPFPELVERSRIMISLEMDGLDSSVTFTARTMPKNNKWARSNDTRTCYSCNEVGHISIRCPYKAKNYVNPKNE